MYLTIAVKFCVGFITGIFLTSVLGTDIFRKYPLRIFSLTVFLDKIIEGFEIDFNLVYGNMILVFVYLMNRYYLEFFNDNRLKIFTVIFGIRKMYEGIKIYNDIFTMSLLIFLNYLSPIKLLMKQFIECRKLGDEWISFKIKNDKTECCICLEDEADISLPCGHCFGKKCLMTAINMNSIGIIFPCPLCRKNYNTLCLNTVWFILQEK